MIGATALRGQTFDANASGRSHVAPEKLRKRVLRRRTLYLGCIASYVLNTLVLGLYAASGQIPAAVVAGYFLCGAVTVGVLALLSERNFNDRFSDHFLTIPLVAINTLIKLVFVFIAPAVGLSFLIELFVIFGYASLRMSQIQVCISWTLMTLGIGGILFGTNVPIGLPMETALERFALLLTFALPIGQCACVGLIANAMRERLYRSGKELKVAYSRIEEMAQIDELTGALNRRFIMRVLGEELAQSDQTGAPCSVALVDLDFFKRINDVYGHPAGDEVLRSFAIAIYANIREADKFGRYGGEEFLLVLPGTDQAAAAILLNQLRVIVSELDWSAMAFEQSVTISIGVAEYVPGEAADMLLARADAALYAAKDAGRNRVILAS